MKYLSICSGIESVSVAWDGLGFECLGVSEQPFLITIIPMSTTLETLHKLKKKICPSNQTSLWEEPLAPPSQSLDLERGFDQIEETSHLSLFSWLKELSLNGYSGKMYPASCHLTEEKTLEPSSEHWENAGMGSLTGFLTLNLSEHPDTPEHCHNEEGVSSLLDVLETGEVPQKFFLTEKQCRAILRRAEKHERKGLPKNLKETLEHLINSL